MADQVVEIVSSTKMTFQQGANFITTHYDLPSGWCKAYGLYSEDEQNRVLVDSDESIADAAIDAVIAMEGYDRAPQDGSSYWSLCILLHMIGDGNIAEQQAPDLMNEMLKHVSPTPVMRSIGNLETARLVLGALTYLMEQAEIFNYTLKESLGTLSTIKHHLQRDINALRKDSPDAGYHGV